MDDLKDTLEHCAYALSKSQGVDERVLLFGLPRYTVQGVTVACTDSDRSMMARLILAMPSKPSSFACKRNDDVYPQHPTYNRPEMVAFLDVWDGDVAKQIVEVAQRVMVEPYGLHVRGWSGGELCTFIDYSQFNKGELPPLNPAQAEWPHSRMRAEGPRAIMRQWDACRMSGAIELGMWFSKEGDKLFGHDVVWDAWQRDGMEKLDASLGPRLPGETDDDRRARLVAAVQADLDKYGFEDTARRAQEQVDKYCTEEWKRDACAIREEA